MNATMTPSEVNSSDPKGRLHVIVHGKGCRRNSLHTISEANAALSSPEGGTTEG